MEHVMDINVPRSRQIRVELKRRGNFWNRAGMTRTLSWPGESSDPAPNPVVFLKNKGP
jgi:hypothetical protein